MTSDHPPVRPGLPGTFTPTPLSVRPPQPWALPEEPLAGVGSEADPGSAEHAHVAGQDDTERPDNNDAITGRESGSEETSDLWATGAPRDGRAAGEAAGGTETADTTGGTEAPDVMGVVGGVEAAGPPDPVRTVPPPPVTGDQAVDEAMELVADTFGADLDHELAAYEAAHRILQDRLADVEG